MRDYRCDACRINHHDKCDGYTNIDGNEHPCACDECAINFLHQ